MTRILVTGPSWVGDMVMAQALFKRLKRLRPDAEIHVVAPGWSAPLTDRMPEVAQSHVLDVPHGTFGFAARRALGRSLRSYAFDEAYVLPRSWKSALVPFFAGAKQRKGYRGEMRFGLLNNIVPRIAQAGEDAPKPRTVDEFVTLADPSEPFLRGDEMPFIARDEASEAETRTHFGIADGTSAIALCPGAEYGPAKQWPLPHFADVARRAGERGHEVWIVGSSKDRPTADAIAESAGSHVRVTAGETTLAQAMDLLAMSRAVVSNDSGLMHVAAAQQKPVVAMFGSSSEKVTPPLSETAHILSRELECRPCFQRTCPLGHLNCLVQITPDDVMAALEPALQS